MKVKMFRHGDLLGKQVKSIPVDAVKKSSGKVNILAEGEITGHHHRMISDVNVTVFEDTDSMYFKLDDEASLVHEEHKELKLAPAIYKVTKEREYDYFSKEIRKVVD